MKKSGVDYDKKSRMKILKGIINFIKRGSK